MFKNTLLTDLNCSKMEKEDFASDGPVVRLLPMKGAWVLSLVPVQDLHTAWHSWGKKL